MSATSDRPNPLDTPDTSTQTAQIDRSTPGGDGIDLDRVLVNLPNLN